jgi:hypothetical protein
MKEVQSVTQLAGQAERLPVFGFKNIKMDTSENK